MQVPFFSITNFLILCAGIFSVLLSLLILKKDYTDWFNRLLFLTFFSWALNIFFYSLVFLSVLDMVLLNFIRDLGVSCGMVASVFLFLSGYYLANGKDVAFQRRNLILLGIFAILMMFFGITDDWVEIIGSISYTKTGFVGNLTIFFVAGIFALIGVLFFFQVYRTLEPSLMRSRVLFFILGASLLISGAILFGLSGLFSPGQYFPLLTATVQFLWVMGPLSIVWGLYGVKSPTSSPSISS